MIILRQLEGNVIGMEHMGHYVHHLLAMLRNAFADTQSDELRARAPNVGFLFWGTM